MNLVTPYLQIFLLLIPWALTALIINRLAIFSRSKRGYGSFNLGVSCYISQFLMAGLIRVIDEAGQHWALRYCLIVLGLATVALILKKISGLFSNKGKAPKFILDKSFSTMLVGAAVCSLTLSFSFMSLWLPSEAWDSLSYWNDIAVRYIDFFGAQVTDPTGRSFPLTSRHPQLVMIMAAWPAWISATWETYSVTYAYWVFTWISAGFIVYGFSQWIGISRRISVLLGYGTLSIPLMENHALLGGYADLHMAVGLLSACAVTAIGLDEQSSGKIALGVLLALSVFALKNTGPFYGSLVIIALVILRFPQNIATRTVAGALVTISALIVINGKALDLKIFDNPIYFDISSGIIVFAGRTLHFQYVEMQQIAYNIVTALFINSSFQLLGALIILGVLIGSRGLAGGGAALVLAVVTLGFVALLSTQYTDYGLEHAQVGKDTGNSRFFLPIMILIPLLIAYSAGLKNQRPSRKSAEP